SEFEARLTQMRCRALLVPAGSTSPAVAVARARGLPILELMPVVDGEAGLFTLGRGMPDGPPPHGPTSGVAEPGDIALVLHTSGTAARPKLVPLTHRNLCASAQSIRTALALVPGDRCLNVMPLFHIHGLSALFASIAAGASVVCIGRFAARQFFEAMDAFHPTWYTAAPTIHREVLENASRHPGVIERSSLRLIRSASAAMPRHLIAEMERVFQVPFIEAYGMTEAAPQIASNRLPPMATRTPTAAPSSEGGS
ncbi:MAG: AMP-dependent synthetase and ligase, partial [Gemmatimonadetes bacterium]|nr:AMP-dependent synthetase and ligase [Gemmatimonadota bacterium]